MGESQAQQYMLENGLKGFGTERENVAKGELLQQHQRVCFTPINPSKFSNVERRQAMISLMLLTQKTNGDVMAKWLY